MCCLNMEYVLRVVDLFSLCIFFHSSIICQTQQVPSSEEEDIIKHQNNFSSGTVWLMNEMAKAVTYDFFNVL